MGHRRAAVGEKGRRVGRTSGSIPPRKLGNNSIVRSVGSEVIIVNQLTKK